MFRCWYRQPVLLEILTRNPWFGIARSDQLFELIIYLQCPVKSIIRHIHFIPGNHTEIMHHSTTADDQYPFRTQRIKFFGKVESLDNVTPADVYWGKKEQILRRRERIKIQNMKMRRVVYATEKLNNI